MMRSQRLGYLVQKRRDVHRDSIGKPGVAGPKRGPERVVLALPLFWRARPVSDVRLVLIQHDRPTNLKAVSFALVLCLRPAKRPKPAVRHGEHHGLGHKPWLRFQETKLPGKPRPSVRRRQRDDEDVLSSA